MTQNGLTQKMETRDRVESRTEHSRRCNGILYRDMDDVCCLCGWIEAPDIIIDKPVQHAKTPILGGYAKE